MGLSWSILVVTMQLNHHAAAIAWLSALLTLDAQVRLADGRQGLQGIFMDITTTIGGTSKVAGKLITVIIQSYQWLSESVRHWAQARCAIGGRGRLGRMMIDISSRLIRMATIREPQRCLASRWLSASIIAYGSGSAVLWTARSTWCGEDPYTYYHNTQAWMYASETGARPGLTNIPNRRDAKSPVAFGFSKFACSGSASVAWLRSPSHHGGDKWGILTTDGSMGGCLGANPLYVNRVAFGICLLSWLRFDKKRVVATFHSL